VVLLGFQKMEKNNSTPHPALSRKGRGEIKRVKRIPLNFLTIDGG
jgi:hypothetical protein